MTVYNCYITAIWMLLYNSDITVKYSHMTVYNCYITVI